MPWLSQLNLLDLAGYRRYQLQIDPAVTQSVLDRMIEPRSLNAFLVAELGQNENLER